MPFGIKILNGVPEMKRVHFEKSVIGGKYLIIINSYLT
jgi:hypothetical protein